MKVKLSTRLIIWVGAPALLLFGGVIWVASQRGFERVVEQTEQHAHGLAGFYAEQIEGTLSRAARIAEDFGIFLESGVITTEEQLQGLIADMVRRSPEIYGSCVAFEPGSFTPGKHFYAPYFYRKEGKAEFVQLGNAQYNYLRWPWYSEPKAAGRPLWSEPYFDEGGGDTVMTTYSVPFRRGGAFWGIVTIDIALTQLVAEVEQLRVGDSGYIFIVSRSGRFLAYPEKSKIMEASVQDANPDLGRKMMQGEAGFMRTREPAQGRPAWIAFQPVQGGEFSIGIVYPQAEVLARAMSLQTELLILGGAAMVLLFAAIIFVARTISFPIVGLAAAAREISQGNLDQRLDIHARSEEVRELANAFRKMTRDLRMRMKELQYTTSVQQRMEGELTAARSIQMSLMTRRFPAFPERHEIDLYASVKPARAVGGDFYDFYFISEDCLCLIIGDVAGKGVPAALFMAVSKTLLKANSARAASPGEMLTQVNEELCDEASSGMFVSVAVVLLNVRTGAVQICNAGHPPPLVISQGKAPAPLPSPIGVALGAWRNVTYQVSHHQLAPGDTLFLYTDGITEARSAREEFYTEERLLELLASLGSGTARSTAKTVIDDVRGFGAGREQADDLTVLTLRWVGSPAVNDSLKPAHSPAVIQPQPT